MSLLRYCKRKGGGEPPSPKRSRLKTVIDRKERDGVVQSDEDEGSVSITTTQAETAGSSTQDKRKQASKISKDWIKGREHWLKYLPEILARKRNALLSVPEVQQEPLCSWHLEHSTMH